MSDDDRYTTEAEDVRITSHEARQRLYEVVRSDIPFEEKAQEALELGKRYLGVDNGHLTQINQATDYWETIVSTDSADGQFPPGLELSLGETYCRRTLVDDAPIALDNAPNQGWGDDPAFEAHGLSCYHGTTLIVDGKPFGTVCFVAEDPRGKSFSEGETMFAELLTRMLERELERDQFEVRLTRQTNLSLVLNRVLRHNLRNEMAVIRGYTQLMAEQLTDSNFGRKALNSIDKLINLSEKARELDEIVASDEERDRTNIRTTVNEVVSGVRSEYPSASITVETDDEVIGTVLPSFRRAMRELIENAAKHAGDCPTIEVAVEQVSNGVEIRIVDDGPGINNQELGVLRSGSETPLMHGSGLGLWLAHWIISQHNGSIEASVTKAGTALTIRVPQTPMAGGQQRISELVRARDQYRAAFDEAGDGMTITNDQARILDVNEEATEIYGMDRQELLGRSIREFLPADFDFEAEWGEIQAADRTRDELKIVSADGGVCDIEYTAKTNVVPGQHLIVSRDVSEQKKRERELSALKQRYETLFEAAPDPIFIADSETGEILDLNTTAEVSLGESREQIIGSHHTSLHPAADADQYRGAFEKYTDTPGTFNRLCDGSQPELVTADGETIPIEIRVDTASLPEKKVRIGIFRNLTEQIADKRELERYKEAVENAGHAIFFTDTDGTIEYINPAFERITGYTAEDAVGNTPNILNSGEMSENYFEKQWRTIQAGEIWEEKVINRRKSGERYQAMQTIAPITNETGELTGYVAVQSDITNPSEQTPHTLYEKPEEPIQMSESIHGVSNIYKLACESALAGIAVANLQGELCKVNPAFLDMWGYDEDDAIGRSVTDFWEDSTKAASVAEDVIERGEWEGTLVAERKDGSMFETRVLASILANENGEPAYIMSSFIDISERASQERELQHKNEQLEELTARLEEQYQTLFEEAPVMAVVTRAENGHPIIEDCNNQFAETLGFEPDALIGTELAEFYTPDSREELIDDGGYERSLEGDFTKEPRELVDADGEIVETLLRAVPRKDASDTVVGTLAMYIDVTEREEVKRANEQLEEFASVVSHDLRNPLTVAAGHLELARDDCESPHLESVERAHSRMGVLIEDLLTLAREGETVADTEAVDLTTAFRECWKIVDTDEASLTVEIDRTVVADESRLKQLFENLIRNSVEHGGSAVTVTVGGLENGFYIEDDGPGIPEADADAVFQAGYSTNDEGTGFGLSIVQRIVEAHEWDINVTNSSNGGARFEITGVEFSTE